MNALSSHIPRLCHLSPIPVSPSSVLHTFLVSKPNPISIRTQLIRFQQSFTAWIYQIFFFFWKKKDWIIIDIIRICVFLSDYITGRNQFQLEDNQRFGGWNSWCGNSSWSVSGSVGLCFISKFSVFFFKKRNHL